MKQFVWCAGLALVLVVVGCGGGGGGDSTESASAPAATPAPAAAPAADAGGVSGTAVYTAEDKDAVIKMDADPQCASFHTDEVYTESIVTDADGNLANVFVYVKEGATAGGSASDTVVLDQVGCIYTPHVTGVMTGQKMVIRNSDQVLHNVHAQPTINEEFNQGQPFAGMELERTFDKAEVMIPVKCDVHPWMKSYIGVLDHPYFSVSAADGSFSIAGLAPGDYVLEAWHEELGTRTQNVTVGASETVDVSFDFTS